MQPLRLAPWLYWPLENSFKPSMPPKSNPTPTLDSAQAFVTKPTLSGRLFYGLMKSFKIKLFFT
jgi:hypothetical protein